MAPGDLGPLGNSGTGPKGVRIFSHLWEFLAKISDQRSGVGILVLLERNGFPAGDSGPDPGNLGSLKYLIFHGLSSCCLEQFPGTFVVPKHAGPARKNHCSLVPRKFSTNRDP